MVADDFDRRFIRANRAIGAKTPEFAGGGADRRGVDIFACRQGSEGDIIDDADGEAVLGLRQFQVVEHRHDVGRNDVFGAEAVATTDDDRLPFLAVERALNVEIQRLADRSRLFGPVKHGDLFDRLGDIAEEMLQRERTIQVDRQQTDLFAFGVQVVDGFLDHVADRTHRDDDAVGVFGAVIVEQVILAAGHFADFCHIFLDDAGDGLIVEIGDFALLEVNVRILGGAANHRMVGVQRPATEGVQRILVDQAGQFVIFDHFNFLRFVRSTETVKEIEERHAAFDRRQMGHRSQVHDLLHAAFGQKGETGLAGRHDVLVIAENAQRIGGNRARADVEYARQQFAGHFVHIGDHQQQAL